MNLLVQRPRHCVAKEVAGVDRLRGNRIYQSGD